MVNDRKPWDTFEKIYGLWDTFSGRLVAISKIKVAYGPKKVVFGPFLKTKVAHRFFRKLEEIGNFDRKMAKKSLKWPFLAVFWRNNYCEHANRPKAHFFSLFSIILEF